MGSRGYDFDGGKMPLSLSLCSLFSSLSLSFPSFIGISEVLTSNSLVTPLVFPTSQLQGLQFQDRPPGGAQLTSFF